MFNHVQSPKYYSVIDLVTPGEEGFFISRLKFLVTQLNEKAGGLGTRKEISYLQADIHDSPLNIPLHASLLAHSLFQRDPVVALRTLFTSCVP